MAMDWVARNEYYYMLCGYRRRDRRFLQRVRMQFGPHELLEGEDVAVLLPAMNDGNGQPPIALYDKVRRRQPLITDYFARRR